MVPADSLRKVEDQSRRSLLMFCNTKIYFFFSSLLSSQPCRTLALLSFCVGIVLVVMAADLNVSMVEVWRQSVSYSCASQPQCD
jgi:hypothetical protein